MPLFTKAFAALSFDGGLLMCHCLRKRLLPLVLMEAC